MRETRSMSLLIRRCKFDNYWRCMKLVNLTKICEPCISSLTNLKISKNFCNIHANSNVLDDKIKKFLDYITNECKNKSCKNNIFEIFNLDISDRLLKERAQLMENIKNLQDLAKEDAEMKKLAKEEEALYKDQLHKLDKRLLDILLTNIFKGHYNSIIVEITAGVGGQEAMLFVKDLYDMYMAYARFLDLNYEVINIDTNDNNGIRHVSIMISGDRVSKFQHEGGVHRVQRVPSTERSGRVHTSTASVAILPAPSEVQIVINEKDLKIEAKRASGPGGQHVNTTDSAVRITHLPSGLAVMCQTQRSQGKNREIAMAKLRSILYEQQLNKQMSFISDLRQKQMGMGLRNEKVRTYNYNQNRVTDHRLQNGTFHNLIEFMEGGVVLQELEDRLHEDIQIKMLLEIARKLETQLKW